MLEKEWTVFFSTSERNARKILSTWYFDETHKQIYPDCYRIITTVDGMRIERKQQRGKKHRERYAFVNGYILRCTYKESEEEFAKIEDVDTTKLINTETRYILNDGELRWKVVDDKKCWKVECEYENSDFDAFIKLLFNSRYVSIMDMCNDNTTRPTSFFLSRSFNMSRHFVYPDVKSPPKCDFYSLKLDGTKYKGTIQENCLIVPCINKTIYYSNVLLRHQSLVVQVELVDDILYVIDVCFLIESSENKKIDILDAIAIMQKLNKLGVQTNFFSRSKKELLKHLRHVKNDGYLGFTKDTIYKFKCELNERKQTRIEKYSNTVDLVYKKCKGKDAEKSKMYHFSSGETIHSIGWTCQYIFVPNEIQFILVEFRIDEEKKMLMFNKFRNDKVEANSLDVFKSMLNGNL